jgi:serine/threonine protein phosphatase 1
MISGLLKMFRKRSPEDEPGFSRQKLFYSKAPEILYAIGDVHGCLAQIRKMEEAIILDAGDRQGEKWIVYLGDLVDRGPMSSGVIDFLMAPPPPGFRRICLCGNHEELMLDFMDNPNPSHQWLALGGEQTLNSYGIYEAGLKKQVMRNKIASHIPQEHLVFLQDLPCMLFVPGFCLVHAGIRPGVALEDQQTADLLWIRPSAMRTLSPDSGYLVVHGHTPVKAIDRTDTRINIDSGAYMNGTLSCIRIMHGEDIKYICVN